MDHNPQYDNSEIRPMGSPIGLELDGIRVDTYLADNFPFWTRSRWRKCFASGRVLKNGRTVRPASKLRIGDQVALYYPATVEPEVDKNIKILWQEGGVMAVYKPPTLPMHENGPYRKNTFAHFLSELAGPEWAALHRLDRETSGVVLCAATAKCRKKLTSDWMARDVKKLYVALVEGQVRQKEWVVEQPIGDLVGSKIRIKKWVVEGGLYARTTFEKIQQYDHCSLLLARPETGRTNQIRIHAAYSGNVLIGDKLYHPNEEVFLEFYDKGATQWVLNSTGHYRHCLHAYSLSFRHPETLEKTQVISPIPEDMLQCAESYQGKARFA